MEGSKRARNKARKKAQIVEAAKKLVIKNGNAEFTMPELAAEAKVALVTPDPSPLSRTPVSLFNLSRTWPKVQHGPLKSLSATAASCATDSITNRPRELARIGRIGNLSRGT